MADENEHVLEHFIHEHFEKWDQRLCNLCDKLNAHDTKIAVVESQMAALLKFVWVAIGAAVTSAAGWVFSIVTK